MIDVLVWGGGFAGLWSAAAAARLLRGRAAGPAGHSVAPLTPHPDLALRPRLYEPDPARLRVPLDRSLKPVGVRRRRYGWCWSSARRWSARGWARRPGR